MMFWIIIFAVPIFVTITFGSLMAMLQSIGDKKFADRTYRQDLGKCLLLSFLPVFWILHPFLSGFYEHGFQFGRRKY